MTLKVSEIAMVGYFPLGNPGVGLDIQLPADFLDEDLVVGFFRKDGVALRLLEGVEDFVERALERVRVVGAIPLPILVVFFPPQFKVPHLYFPWTILS